MWLHGAVDLPRQSLFHLKSVKTNASWHPKQSLYGNPVNADPFTFAYAATRTSIVGTHIGLRGSIAGAGLSIAAAAYLQRSAPDLNFHHRFNNVKDFVGTGIKGTVGAAFAYIYMLNKGYVWAGHWEDVVTKSAKGPHPDFVFASDTQVCLLDAKGSSSPHVKVDGLVKQEWKRQIWPHKTTPFHFGGRCTEGAVIATVVSPTVSASFVKAYGQFAPPSPQQRALAIRSIQRANYINACFLLGLRDTAFALLASARPNTSPSQQLSHELGNAFLPESDLLLSPPRLILQNGDHSYSMRYSANVRTLREMIESFDSNDVATEAPPEAAAVKPREYAQYISDDSETVVIDGPDGIGARFALVR